MSGGLLIPSVLLCRPIYATYHCVCMCGTSACVRKESDLAPRPIEDVALLVPLVGAPAHHEQLGGPQRGVQIFWEKLLEKM
jgi:hypothetical protein